MLPARRLLAVVGTTVICLSYSSVFASAEVLPPTSGWTEIKPGGATTCARGDEFSFFVSPGTSSRVVIDFIGGGACWNAATCAKESATFTDSVEEVRRHHRAGLQGIYDHTRADNPVRDWTHVVIPYCTGDIHWGNSAVTYTRQDGTSFDIQHKGAVNTKAVLKWVQERIQSPEKVLVTGCSAGSYGSIYWSPAIRKIFPASEFYQLGDSGAGVITPEFTRESFSIWNAVSEAPSWIPGLDPLRTDWLSLTLTDIYKYVGSYHPRASFSQYNPAFDNTQTFFYELMGGNPQDWSRNMFASIQKIQASTPNFTSFTAPGEDHCIIPFNRFYTLQSNGVRYQDWVRDYLEGKKPASVTCSGKDCDPDGIGG